MDKNKSPVVAKFQFGKDHYLLHRNGMVEAKNLETGRGFVQHIRSIPLSIQQKMEEDLRAREKDNRRG